MIIWPDFEIVQQEYGNKLETHVRKQHKDEWYLCKIRIDWHGAFDLHQYFKSFFREIYLFQQFGKINLDLLDSQGLPMYKRDPDQRSEKERLGIIIEEPKPYMTYMQFNSISAYRVHKESSLFPYYESAKNNAYIKGLILEAEKDYQKHYAVVESIPKEVVDECVLQVRQKVRKMIESIGTIEETIPQNLHVLQSKDLVKMIQDQLKYVLFTDLSEQEKQILKRPCSKNIYKILDNFLYQLSTEECKNYFELEEKITNFHRALAYTIPRPQ